MTSGNFWEGYTGDILEQSRKAAAALASLGNDAFVMNNYRNANPQTRGTYDEFRTKWYQHVAQVNQQKAEQDKLYAPGALLTGVEGGVPVYNAQGLIASYAEPGSPLNLGYSYEKPIFAGMGGGTEVKLKAAQPAWAGGIGGTTGGGGALAPSLGGETWPGGGVQWPSQGLATAASGGAPRPANLLPSLGAPGFLSPQNTSRLTPSELDIYGSEVERRGFPLQDWWAQQQQQLGGFAFPGQYGGGMARITRAPGQIR